MSMRILFATFGSAGDVFPLIPVVQQLRRDGHDVRCAAPRALGLYLRTAGLPMHALGDGSEMRVFDDHRIVTTRLGGWASWRHVLLDYVAPTLERDLATLDDLVTSWCPDAIVTSGFAIAARVVADRRAIPRLEATIYPQQLDPALETSRLAWQLRELLARASDRAVDDPVLAAWMWGVGSADCVLLHDTALLHDWRPAHARAAAHVPIGFPYWDDAPSRPDDLARVDGWRASSDRPAVLVTLGSFLGARQRQAWIDAALAVGEVGARPLLVGPRGRWGDDALPPVPGLLAVGYVPLSGVMAKVDAVVHHGGIGTMFASLRAGRPAVVLPQAFDQPFNAKLVAGSGAGVDGSGSSLASAVGRVLDDRAMTTRAQTLCRELVPSERAVETLTERVLQAAARSRSVVSSTTGGSS